MTELPSLAPASVKGALEALLLVSTDAVSAIDLAKVLGIAPGEAASALAELAAEYADANRGFQLREVAGGWRLFTHPAYHDAVERYVISWDTRRLSQAALETLAVIAYHQPVTREGVKAVRGVNSDGVIASLKEKRLVREVGREGERGTAILYGTTQAFLEKFGLRTLKDLPPLEDFAPDEESRAFIRERLSGRSIASTIEDAAADIDEERELLGVPADDAEADAFLTQDADSGAAFAEDTVSDAVPAGKEYPDSNHAEHADSAAALAEDTVSDSVPAGEEGPGSNHADRASTNAAPDRGMDPDDAPSGGDADSNPTAEGEHLA